MADDGWGALDDWDEVSGGAGWSNIVTAADVYASNAAASSSSLSSTHQPTALVPPTAPKVAGLLDSSVFAPANKSTARFATSAASLFEVIQRSGVTTQMALAVLRTAERLFVTPSEAACLLRAYHWNRTSLEQDWYANSDKVRREAGVPQPLDLARFTAEFRAHVAQVKAPRAAAVAVAGPAAALAPGSAAFFTAPPAMGVDSIVIGAPAPPAAVAAAPAAGPVDPYSLPAAPAGVPTPFCAGARDETFFYDAAETQVYVQCSTAYCDRVALDAAAALGCGHWFCADCWQTFLASEIETLGRGAVFTRCMGMQCTDTSRSHRHGLGCKCTSLVPMEFFDRFVRRPPATAPVMAAASSLPGAADGASDTSAGAGGAAAGGALEAPLMARAVSIQRQQSLANAVAESAAVAAAAAAAVVPGGKLLPAALTRVPSAEVKAAASAAATAIGRGAAGPASSLFSPSFTAAVAGALPANASTGSGSGSGGDGDDSGARLVSRLESWLVDFYVEKTAGIKWCPRPGCGSKSLAASQSAAADGKKAAAGGVDGDKKGSGDKSAGASDGKGGDASGDNESKTDADDDDGPYALLDKSDGLLGILPVTCKCGHSFCFQCSDAAHVPAPCDIVRAWKARSAEDMSDVWIAAQTKQCPKCQVRIEKNRACNHMTCANCRHQFCWLCLADWSKHNASTGGSYICNRYNAAVEKGGITDQEKKQIDLQQSMQKYNYYVARVQQHRTGAMFAQKLVTEFNDALRRVRPDLADDMLAQMGIAGHGKGNVSGNTTFAVAELMDRFVFVQEAFDRIIQARSVLEWSFVTAFYLKTNDTKRLFEMQQELLVNTVESLQEILEEINSDMVSVYAQKKAIMDSVTAIDSMRKYLTQHISGGDLENSLLYDADAGTSTSFWVCRCGHQSSLDIKTCVKCESCRRHGEPECKICQHMKL